MNAFRLLGTALLNLCLLPAVRAQVVTTQPVFFTENTPITLTYDASQGNGGLNNFTGNVYIWTGVVTNRSPNNTTWRYTKSPSFSQADPAALMTRDASNPNLYRISFTPRAFYPALPANETILRLGMIFKDATGATIGRNSDGGDIFVDVYSGTGQAVRITTPTLFNGLPPVVAPNAPLTVSGNSAQAATLTLTINGAPVATQTNTTAFSTTITPTQSGRNVIRLTAGSGATAVSDSVIILVRPTITTAALPAGAKEGVTYLPGGTSVILALTAPNKQFVYAIGEFNNFLPDNATLMNRTADGNIWWVQLNGLTPGREYAYQYLVDGSLRVADPYTEKVLDPGNDRFIPAVTYPNLRAYPAGQNAGIMSVLQTNQTPYVWQTTSFTRPAKTDLVIYELLLRDFIQRHDFQTLRDTLGYLQKLGVNCIELMPVNEFEGNDSWGYNPSFYFAVDKYYGTKDNLKRFIDEAHRRGMAVVLDMVLNHSCDQSPMAQLYRDNGGVTAANPWYNRVARHPFNVCNDFNHESPFTRAFSKNVMDFWVNEFRVDGYRFDLSKGFTQTNSGSNVGAWGNFDQSRINIWMDYNNHMQATRPGTYVILEHFAANSEETVLANAGMMPWGNVHYFYSQGAQARYPAADFSSAYYRNRGWQQPNLVAYMESHDEERNMVETQTSGLFDGADYNTRTLHTALDRMALTAAFFFTIPGPKMIWQFGELGYDLSINTCANGTINNNCRVGAKPIRWRYYTDSLERRQLYQTYANLIALKKHPAFATGTFTGRFARLGQSIHINHPSLNVTVIGNFSVFPGVIDPAFQNPGRWYNYLTGDSITVTGVNDLISLPPGGYAVYTSSRVRLALGARPSEASARLGLSAVPNPAAGRTSLHYTLPAAATVAFTVQNVLGQTVYVAPARRQSAGPQAQELSVAGLPAGLYLVCLQAGELRQTTRLVVE